MVFLVWTADPGLHIINISHLNHGEAYSHNERGVPTETS